MFKPGDKNQELTVDSLVYMLRYNRRKMRVNTETFTHEPTKYKHGFNQYDLIKYKILPTLIGMVNDKSKDIIPYKDNITRFQQQIISELIDHYQLYEVFFYDDLTDKKYDREEWVALLTWDLLTLSDKFSVEDILCRYGIRRRWPNGCTDKINTVIHDGVGISSDCHKDALVSDDELDKMITEAIGTF